MKKKNYLSVVGKRKKSKGVTPHLSSHLFLEQESQEYQLVVARAFLKN